MEDILQSAAALYRLKKYSLDQQFNLSSRVCPRDRGIRSLKQFGRIFASQSYKNMLTNWKAKRLIF
jgi:hypothetical protein